jgi:5-methylcytosine-specific restriction endonuclease McrA
MMEKKLEALVWRRAHDRCEYCCLQQTYSVLTFEVDHIIAIKHGGPTVASNLALSCFYCNSFKGPNVAGFDPKTRKLTRLFHPRCLLGTVIFVGMDRC